MFCPERERATGRLKFRIFCATLSHRGTSFDSKVLTWEGGGVVAKSALSLAGQSTLNLCSIYYYCHDNIRNTIF